MWRKVIICTTICIVLLHGNVSANVIRDIFEEPIQEYDVIIRNIAYEDSPVDNNDCAEGYQLDINKICREVW